MRCSSPAFGDGKPIPSKYARQGVVGGQNISPPFIWEDFPQETRSFALSMVDPHPIASNWIHWLVINIPRAISAVGEGDSPSRMPRGCRELYNSFGEKGYGGPQPPKGSGPHPYVTTIYALDVETIDLTGNSTLDAFEKAVEEHLLASAKFTGLYER